MVKILAFHVYSIFTFSVIINFLKIKRLQTQVLQVQSEPSVKISFFYSTHIDFLPGFPFHW